MAEEGGIRHGGGQLRVAAREHGRSVLSPGGRFHIGIGLLQQLRVRRGAREDDAVAAAWVAPRCPEYRAHVGTHEMAMIRGAPASTDAACEGDACTRKVTPKNIVSSPGSGRCVDQRAAAEAAAQVYGERTGRVAKEGVQTFFRGARSPVSVEQALGARTRLFGQPSRGAKDPACRGVRGRERKVATPERACHVHETRLRTIAENLAKQVKQSERRAAASGGCSLA